MRNERPPRNTAPSICTEPTESDAIRENKYVPRSPSTIPLPHIPPPCNTTVATFMRRTIYIPSQIAFPQRKCILFCSPAARLSLGRHFVLNLVHHEFQSTICSPLPPPFTLTAATSISSYPLRLQYALSNNLNRLYSSATNEMTERELRIKSIG